MPDIPFPTSSSPGTQKHEGGGRLVNCYSEKLTGNPRWEWVRRRVPGISRLQATGHVGTRGFLEVNGGLYVAQANRLLYITLADGGYTVADVGELPGTDLVTMARNNKAPTPDVQLVSDVGLYNVTPSSLALAVDADLPQPNSIDFGFGYIFYGIANGQIFASGINDTTVSALDFTTADARPDGLLRVIVHGERLLAFGQNSLQIYHNTGNPTGFPLSAGPVITRGLIGKWAVAGQEAGWAGQLIFVGDDNVVYLLNGNSPAPISSPYLSRLIAKVTDKSTLHASVYTHGSNAKWALSSPDWTWEFNLSTQQWNERQSGIASRWRGSRSVYAFGRWVVGDFATDLIGEVSDEVYSEYGDPIRMLLESGPGHAFPGRVAISRADFDIGVGQGRVNGADPIESDPILDISMSKDGGYTFGESLRRPLGKQGEYTKTVGVNRCGMASSKGIVWRLQNSDRVNLSVFGGSMQAEQRAR